MIGVKSHADKAIDAVERNRAALARSTGRLAQHDAARPDGEDGDALYAWKRSRPDLEDRVEADREALAFAERRAEHARAELAEKAASAEHMAEQRRAAADEKLLWEADALASKLAAKLAEIEASRERTAVINERRGSRAPILDAETRVRQRPGAMVEARMEEKYVWVDAAGNRVRDQILDDDRKWIWNPAAVNKAWVTEVLAEAYQGPPEMPARLTGEFRLVDLQGQTIWPR